LHSGSLHCGHLPSVIQHILTLDGGFGKKRKYSPISLKEIQMATATKRANTEYIVRIEFKRAWSGLTLKSILHQENGEIAFFTSAHAAKTAAIEHHKKHAGVKWFVCKLINVV